MKDALNRFSNKQVLTATAASTDAIPLSDLTQNRQIGDGEPMSILIVPSVSAVAGDSTYSVAVQTDDDDAFGSPTTLLTQPLTAAQLAAGKAVAIGLPSGKLYEKNLRLNYTLGGAAPGVTLSAFLLPSKMVPQYSQYYKSGFTIL